MANLKQIIQNLENQPTNPALIALEDKVIVKVVEAPTTSKGGIILPDSVKIEEQEGLVVAVGTHTLAGNPMEVKVGDYVMFPKFAGVPQTVDEVELRSIRHADISFISRRAKVEGELKANVKL